MSTMEEMIGRSDANDLDAILAIENPHINETIHAVKDNAEAIFTWDYEKGARPALNKLYEKAKNSQWNGETDLDWSIDVDQEKLAAMGLSAEAPRARSTSPAPASRTGPTRSGSSSTSRCRTGRSQPVHARRAGRADLHRQDRRDRAVDRRQVLRRRPR